MYLGKHSCLLYTEYLANALIHGDSFFVVIEKQLLVGLRNVRVKNYLVNINVNLYTLRLLILTETCFKDRNSVFATHCTGDILNLVHTDGHAVAVSEIHKVTPSTTF